MARQYLMSWVPGVKRWAKNYRGKNYAVSCLQLGVPPTKQDSWRAANEWWTAKKTELDAANPPARTPAKPHPHQAALNHVDDQLDWARQHATAEVAGLEANRQAIAEAREQPTPPAADEELIAENIAWFLSQGGVLPENLTPYMRSYMFGNRRLWNDRFTHSPTATVPVGRTLKDCADRFLAGHKPNCKAGTFGLWQKAINEFISFATDDGPLLLPTMAPSAINENIISKIGLRFATRIAAGRVDPGTANARIQKYRRFVSWLHTERLIEELPRNLYEKSMRFKNPTKQVKVPPLSLVVDLLGDLPERERLFALLSLNCGMLQSDISDLRQEQVDWEKGTLTRRRIKTGERSDRVPTVTYWLWPETLRLLTAHRSDKENVLLTERGTVLVDVFERNGKSCKKDNITLRWKRLMRKRRAEGKQDLEFGKFRKVGATLLDQHKVFGRYVQHWLAHAPSSVMDKHYKKPSRRNFRRALIWLGRKLAILPKPESKEG